jgi:hypothetical protein
MHNPFKHRDALLKTGQKNEQYLGSHLFKNANLSLGGKLAYALCRNAQTHAVASGKGTQSMA